jgi:hypothetical protein
LKVLFFFLLFSSLAFLDCSNSELTSDIVNALGHTITVTACFENLDHMKSHCVKG